ncbi:hypothetical protein EDB83DRAFT_2501420, partial [Lactarius deliciosus]
MWWRVLSSETASISSASTTVIGSSRAHFNCAVFSCGLLCSPLKHMVQVWLGICEFGQCKGQWHVGPKEYVRKVKILSHD